MGTNELEERRDKKICLRESCNLSAHVTSVLSLFWKKFCFFLQGWKIPFSLYGMKPNSVGSEKVFNYRDVSPCWSCRNGARFSSRLLNRNQPFGPFETKLQPIFVPGEYDWIRESLMKNSCYWNSNHFWKRKFKDANIFDTHCSGALLARIICTSCKSFNCL